MLLYGTLCINKAIARYFSWLVLMARKFILLFRVQIWLCDYFLSYISHCYDSYELPTFPGKSRCPANSP